MRRILTCLLLLLAAPAAAQQAVAIRPVAVVEGTTIRLGDLFEGAGAKAETPIGTAPPPGRRLVVEPPQLFAIARLHGLTWRPLSAGERVVIERPGRPVGRAEVEEVLRADLLRLGLAPEAELDLGTFAPPMVPPAAIVQLALEGLSYDDAQARFGATLVVTADGAATQRVRLAGRALATVPVVLATRRMALGDVVRAADVRLGRMRAERVRPGAAERPEQVVGQQLRRPQAEGQPVLTSDLGPPAVVAKNALVVMVVEAPGLSLSAQGRALDAAPLGGLVQVLNLESHAVIEAQAIGPGRVRVAIGATPSFR